MYRRYYRNGDMESMSPQLSYPVANEKGHKDNRDVRENAEQKQHKTVESKKPDLPNNIFPTDKLIKDGKFLGKWETDEVVLMALIFLLLQGDNTDTLLVLALAYVLLN